MASNLEHGMFSYVKLGLLDKIKIVLSRLFVDVDIYFSAYLKLNEGDKYSVTLLQDKGARFTRNIEGNDKWQEISFDIPVINTRKFLIYIKTDGEEIQIERDELILVGGFFGSKRRR